MAAMIIACVAFAILTADGIKNPIRANPMLLGNRDVWLLWHLLWIFILGAISCVFYKWFFSLFFYGFKGYFKMFPTLRQAFATHVLPRNVYWLLGDKQCTFRVPSNCLSPWHLCPSHGFITVVKKANISFHLGEIPMTLFDLFLYSCYQRPTYWPRTKAAPAKNCSCHLHTLLIRLFSSPQGPTNIFRLLSKV